MMKNPTLTGWNIKSHTISPVMLRMTSTSDIQVSTLLLFYSPKYIKCEYNNLKGECICLWYFFVPVIAL